MEDLPGMSDNAIIALVALCIIAGAAGVFIFQHAQKMDESRGCFSPNQDIKHWRPTPWQRGSVLCAIVVGLALVALTSWTTQRDDAALAAERARDLEVALQRLGCPPKQPGDTDIITLTFDTSADLHTDKPFRAHNCARIVERGWFKQQQKRAPAIAARE